jgi:hypothetical protein
MSFHKIPEQNFTKIHSAVLKLFHGDRQEEVAIQIGGPQGYRFLSNCQQQAEEKEK